MKKTTTLLFAGALALAAAGQPKTYTGIVTDTMCGADHAHMNIQPVEKCVRECVKADKKYKYALLVGKDMYVLSDQQTPEKFAGQKVKVNGTLYEKTTILKVESIEAAK
jgi:hypothetical protein